MSKKHRRRQQFNQFNQSAVSPSAPQAGGAMSGELAEEYKIIKSDLLRVLAVNVIFLALVLAVYYTNLHSGYLERLFGKILHF